jgi:hypothetical protein
METQNISAQLFVKQLPQAQLASFDGAKTDYNTNYLNTSVNYPDSDKNIEDAFQKQLDLSDYYKSVQVFDTMKKVFDTNEGTFNTNANIPVDRDLKKNPFSSKILPVGPRDSVYDQPDDSLVNKAKESFGNIKKYSKESFGKDASVWDMFKNKWFWIIIAIVAVLSIIMF